MLCSNRLDLKDSHLQVKQYTLVIILPSCQLSHIRNIGVAPDYAELVKPLQQYELFLCLFRISCAAMETDL